MNKKHLFQNADKTLDGLKNLPKGKNLIRYRNCETENNYIRKKGFINCLMRDFFGSILYILQRKVDVT